MESLRTPKRATGALFAFILFLTVQNTFSQEVFQHISNTSIYDFLDELANGGIININSAVKPYSRKAIADYLQEASGKKDLLNKRQQQKLDFFLKDFNKELLPAKSFKKRKDLFYYKDSLFTVTINPILGGSFLYNDSGFVYTRWGGAETYGYIGPFGFYANLKDNFESTPLSLPNYYTDRLGANYKNITLLTSADYGEYSEMRGGITYSWRWGSIGALKDHFAWGNNYHGSNIFSGRTPSFAQIRLHLQPVKWLDFNYVHGWPVSGVPDSSRSYRFTTGNITKTRIVYQGKYIAANLLTVSPFRKLNVSVGNSVVYSNLGFNPAYIMPVFFYKTLDHTYSYSNNGGQNAQMFFDISSRQIKNIHLYTSVFVDEVAFGDFWKKDSLSNFFSGKFGFCWSNFLPNWSFITEYTATRPLTYKHFIPTTTFESNGFNLGHYLRDNAQEIFFQLKWKPVPNMQFTLDYLNALKGNDYVYIGGWSARGLPFQENIIWTNQTISAKINYEIINDAFAFFQVSLSDIQGDSVKVYTPNIFIGNLTTVSAGLNFGF